MATLDEMYNEATKLKDDGDLGGAVAKLKEMLEQEETNTLAHAALAVHLQKLGQHEQAIAHAKRVTELEPDDAFSYSQLSVICMRCGLIPEAEDAMAKAREIQAGGGAS